MNQQAKGQAVAQDQTTIAGYPMVFETLTRAQGTADAER
jgi:hypothetical protein